MAFEKGVNVSSDFYGYVKTAKYMNRQILLAISNIEFAPNSHNRCPVFSSKINGHIMF